MLGFLFVTVFIWPAWLVGFVSFSTITMVQHNWSEKVDVEITEEADGGMVYRMSPEEVKKRKEFALRMLEETNWLIPAVFATVFVFGVTGLACGFILRSFVFVGLIPVLNIFFWNLFSRNLAAFSPLKLRDGLFLTTEAYVIVLTQFAAIYLFGYLGFLLGKRLDKRRAAKQAASAP